jgi:hypothetical protein
LLVSVWVRVAEPAGVSTRVLVRERDVSVVCGLFASTSTVVDDELGAGADADGSTMVVEELFAGGTSRTVSLSFWITVGGSFTTVVLEGVAERSQPASAPTASTARTGMTYLIEASDSSLGPHETSRRAADFSALLACGWF